MSAKHTPGPWKRTGALTVRGGALGRLIAKVDGGGSINSEEIYANTRLIAAAPDMLEALKNLENDDGNMPPSAWALVQQAIAKAEGKE